MVTSFSPLTTVRVLKNVPLDSSYTDTLDFSSVSAQTAYFASKAAYTFTNVAPVRIPNTIRLDIPADDIYNCNYVMFQNANFGSKWFYGFITKIEWLNVNACTVTYDLDIIQTWWFDIEINDCYVEREHSVTDNIGDNLVAENIELGDYVTETAEKTPFFDYYVAVIAAGYQVEGQDPPGGYIGGLFTGLNYIAGPINNEAEVEQLKSYLQAVVNANQQDSVASTFIMPQAFYTTDSLAKSQRFDANKNYSSIGGYVPKNKKLFTYPYNYLQVSSASGQSKAYRYEYFANENECGFLLSCALSCNPEIILEPIAYNSQTYNVDESLCLSGFPQFAWSIDTYKAWLAQNATGTMLQLVGNMVSTGLSIATGNPFGVAEGVLGISNTINNVVQASFKSDQTRGSQGTSTLTGTFEMNFYFYNRHLREDNLKIIDDYFSRFGYATKRLKKPNINSRPSWNYVKTLEANITGAVPFDDLARIKECFNKGITFWHGDWVGDYDRSNSPS